MVVLPRFRVVGKSSFKLNPCFDAPPKLIEEAVGGLVGNFSSGFYSIKKGEAALAAGLETG